MVKREEPTRPPSPHPLHRSTCHWLAFTMRMMLQRDAVYLLHHASSRSDRPSATSAGRSCWPSSLGEKSTRGSSFTALFLRSFCCLSPAGTTMYITAHKKSTSRGAFPSTRRSTRCKPCLTIWSITTLGYRTGPRNCHGNVVQAVGLDPLWDFDIIEYTNSYITVTSKQRGKQFIVLLQKVSLR